MDELSNEDTINESGGEVIDGFVQSIPGTAPNFDTLVPETENINKNTPKKQQQSDPEAYKATSTNDNHQKS